MWQGWATPCFWCYFWMFSCVACVSAPYHPHLQCGRFSSRCSFVHKGKHLQDLPLELTLKRSRILLLSKNIEFALGGLVHILITCKLFLFIFEISLWFWSVFPFNMLQNTYMVALAILFKFWLIQDEGCFVLLLLFFFLWDRIFLCSPRCSGTLSRPGWPQGSRDPLVSASWVLGFKVYT